MNEDKIKFSCIGGQQLDLLAILFYLLSISPNLSRNLINYNQLCIETTQNGSLHGDIRNTVVRTKLRGLKNNYREIFVQNFKNTTASKYGKKIEVNNSRRYSSITMVSFQTVYSNKQRFRLSTRCTIQNFDRFSVDSLLSSLNFVSIFDNCKNGSTIIYCE